MKYAIALRADSRIAWLNTDSGWTLSTRNNRTLYTDKARAVMWARYMVGLAARNAPYIRVALVNVS